MRVLVFEDGARGVEVVDSSKQAVLLPLTTALELFFVKVVARRIGKQVGWPSEKQAGKYVPSRVEWRVLHNLVELLGRDIPPLAMLLSRPRQEDHIALHVCCGLVMLAVGDLPGEVGHK